MTASLDIRLLSLACCGSEAAGIVRSWRSQDQAAPAGGSTASVTIPVLVIAGTITQPMAASVLRAIAELPPTGRVIVFGVCAASGGPYWDSPVVVEGLRSMVPGGTGGAAPEGTEGADARVRSLVEEAVVVPGCPPTGVALANSMAVVAEQNAESPSDGGAG
ncbi:MAG: hypothetical protein Q8P61_06640 [Candidatus Nanopelagicales bacterium]|nr:hypothetical protein [Candidatus Nanopelagicales bacterium]